MDIINKKTLIKLYVKIRKDLSNVPVETDSMVMELIVKISMNVKV